MHPELAKRLTKLKDIRKRCSGVLLSNADRWSNPNFFWLSNTTASGWLWVPFKGRPRLFTRTTWLESARNAWAKVENITKLEDVLAALPKARIGVDGAHTPAPVFNKIKSRARATDISEHLEAARAVKTPYEILQIRRACKLAAEVFRTIRLPYRGSEARLRADLEWEVASRGLESAFPAIVASGKNIAIPHHVPAGMQASKPLLVDLGVRYNGYCSDVTRTFGSRYQPVIEKVFAAIEPLLKPGAHAADIDAAARAALGSYEKHFITALGHGLGIAVHEPPNIRKDSKGVLQPGNVLTLEPGIYVTGGIRHENVYLITHRGAEDLTAF